MDHVQLEIIYQLSVW